MSVKIGHTRGDEAALRSPSLVRLVALSSAPAARVRSSEVSKLVANAFLAQRVSSINSISALCEVTSGGCGRGHGGCTGSAAGAARRVVRSFPSVGDAANYAAHRPAIVARCCAVPSFRHPLCPASCALKRRCVSPRQRPLVCLGQATDADVFEVQRALAFDARIGPKFLNASVGFGGSCFQKDILNLVYICESLGLKECADYWHQVILMNEYQKSRFSKIMVSRMFNTITGKKICALGFAFKKDTGDTRETAAAFVCRDLLEEAAVVHVFDPKVTREQMLAEMDYTLKVNHATNPRLDEMLVTAPDAYAAAEGAHGLAVLTEWDEFKTYDYARIFQSMAKPAFIFDGRNLLNHEELKKIGFEVYCIGKPTTKFF